MQAADRATGNEYLKIEAQLRALGAKERERAAETPFQRLIATVCDEWSGSRHNDMQAALDYLDYLPNRVAMTAMGIPSPEGAASYLRLHFEDRVTDLLSVRLAANAGWPHWRVLAVLIYLLQQKAPSSTPGVVRFAASTGNAEHRRWAIEALKACRHPGLAAEIDAERRRAQRLKREFPDELSQLASGR